MPILALPPETVTSAVARITYSETLVSVRLPEKREDFRYLVKELDYTWSGFAWERRISPVSGPAIDRAAELGRKLLATGFPVEFPNEQVRDKAVDGTFAPERKRWIIEDKGMFRLQWRRSADAYREASRLAGARYDPPGILVPADFYNEVLDFAEINGFLVTGSAQRLAEMAEARRKAGQVVDLKPLKREPEKPKAEPETYDVDDELRDEPI